MSVQTKIPSLSPKVRITSSVRKSKSVHQEVQKLCLSGGSSLKFWKQFFSRDFRKIPYSKSDLMRRIDKKWKACCQSQNAGCYADWTYFWPDDSFFNLLKICDVIWENPSHGAKLIFWVIDIMWKFELFSFQTLLLGSPLILV